ncbi:mitochondrial carrier domain-containing protein [Tuber borchii]|uniref:Mitochondrial carrier domain-containing protein n=1 Tax=Tuber borchii TaxID=42251 RepID=A0A2T7A8I9_TUBBO|nr:mitochondrial carrier domain-containing protein [Tuber borchii]
MSAKNGNGGGNGKKKPTAAVHLIAGGGAGLCEALACHPLDTIKVRMQLSRRNRAPGVKRKGFFLVGKEIVKRETPLGLYKGLGAVVTGIVPKMAIRFSSFEFYKSLAKVHPETGRISAKAVFISGLVAGATEAVAVVTPMEVIKIRLQAQHHSMADPLDIPKYRNAAHAAYTVVREEGFRTLYRGVTLTALRQSTNQAVNFTAYTYMKQYALNLQPNISELPSYQHLLLGLVSGAMGPLSNAPIDTIKTRLQRSEARPGESALKRITIIAKDMFKHEGFRAFYQGITPRIMRVAPGQAVTFMMYEFIRGHIERFQVSGDNDNQYRE